jgi:Flp pilus assembly protein TadD
VATVYGWDLGEGAREKAIEASERAIELDRTLPEAHISRAVVAALDGDLAGGISRALHAVSLAPESPLARHWLSMLYKIEGRYEEADKEGRLALGLDPELSVAHLNLAHVAILSGHPEAAEERMRAVTSAHPELLLARVLLAWAQIRQGETRRAVETLGAAGVIAPGDPLVVGMRGLALAVAGEVEGARVEASRAVRLSAGDPSALTDYAVAGVYALTGSPGEAFGYLRKALEAETRDLWTVVPGDYVREDPALASLRPDPRFEELVRGLRGTR